MLSTITMQFSADLRNCFKVKGVTLNSHSKLTENKPRTFHPTEKCSGSVHAIDRHLSYLINIENTKDDSYIESDFFLEINYNMWFPVHYFMSIISSLKTNESQLFHIVLKQINIACG